MNYFIVETKLTYEQFRESFKRHVKTNIIGGKPRELDKEIYFGSISKESFMINCGLPLWRGGTNWLTGKIIEEDGTCTLIYKLAFAPDFYKWGKKIILAVFCVNFCFWLFFLCWRAVFERCYMNCIMISPFVIMAGIMISNTKKEGEYCKKKLEEIITDIDSDRCEEHAFEKNRKIQAEVIMLDNFHNPKLLVCQETRADGVQVQYYKDKEKECFIEKIGDFVTVEIDEADESKYRILEREK